MVLLIEAYGCVDHTPRHESDRGKVLARDRSDLFKLHLFDEVLESNTPDESATGKPDQHRLFGAGERLRYDLYIIHGFNHSFSD